MDILGIVNVPGYVIAAVVLLLVAYIYYTWNFSVWKDTGLPHPKPIPVLGTLYIVLKHGVRYADIENIKTFGKIHGTYEGRQPVCVAADPEFLKEVTIKEFSNFVNRRNIVELADPVLGLNLLRLQDEHWKHVRSFVTPAFSSGKMRSMSPLIIQAAERFLDNLQNHVEQGKEVDVKDIAGKFTIEAIASIGFGIQLDAQSDDNHPFICHAKLMVNSLSFSNVWFLLSFLAPFTTPVLRRLGVTMINSQSKDFFTRVVTEAIEVRKTSYVSRTDFLKLMVDAEKELDQEQSSKDNTATHQQEKRYTKKRGLTNAEIIAQAVLFIIAGYETTATTLSYVLYNLAVYPEFQDKAVQEINTALPEDIEPNYDNVNKLQYLDQVIDETLRIFPPLARMDRVASRDIEIQGYKIPKGAAVVMPIMALHMNPEVWPDPERFDPDRFLPEAKVARHPLNFVPFGAGPRICVGRRLAQLELKIVLVKALRKFKFLKTANTLFPLELNKYTIGSIPLSPAMVGIQLRNQSGERH